MSAAPCPEPCPGPPGSAGKPACARPSPGRALDPSSCLIPAPPSCSLLVLGVMGRGLPVGHGELQGWGRDRDGAGGQKGSKLQQQDTGGLCRRCTFCRRGAAELAPMGAALVPAGAHRVVGAQGGLQAEAVREVLGARPRLLWLPCGRTGGVGAAPGGCSLLNPALLRGGRWDPSMGDWGRERSRGGGCKGSAAAQPLGGGSRAQGRLCMGSMQWGPSR